MNSLPALILSMRPRQWTKNLFVFAAVLFARRFFDTHSLVRVSSAFVAFCAMSGAVYLFNDIRDLESDRHHPLKSLRPLASGKITPLFASLAAALITLIALAGSYALSVPFFWTLAAYAALQVTYTLILKHLVIIDVFSLSLGFVLRVVAGAVVIGVEISSWLLLCTILLSLFLALSKRRHELSVLEEGAATHRKVLADYSHYLLDQMIAVVTPSTVVAYALYTLSDQTVEKFGTTNLILTVPFVIYGIFRYLYLVHRKNAGGRPETTLLTDRPLLINVFLWAAVAGFIVYR